MQVLQKNQRYTYSDYLTWHNETRYELIDGVPYMMSPAPSRTHQRISGEIYAQLHLFLKGKACEVFHAPFDIRLDTNDNDDTVCQPDISVICNKSKLDEKGCKGAPDLIIEIISPSSASRDRFIKFNKYLQAGVREYWIVDPDSKTVSVHILENGRYVTAAYGETDSIPVFVLEGCRVDFGDVFES